MTISCNKESLIGSDLLNEDNINVNFTDTLKLGYKTLYSDSTRTFATDGVAVSSLDKFTLGKIEDPVFGTTETKFYVCPNFNSIPNFRDGILDSMVLVIPLDTSVRYGDLTATHDVKMYQMSDLNFELDINSRMDTIFSNQSFDVDSPPISEKSGTFTGLDSISVFNPIGDSTVLERPQLRMRLNDMLAMSIFDTNYVETDSIFQSNIKGFMLESETVNSFIGLQNRSVSGTTSDGKIRVHYRVDEDLDGTIEDTSVYQFNLAIFKHAEMIHDFAGTPVEQAISSGSDSELYIQGKVGVYTEVDLTPILAYGDTGINYAELEFQVNEDLSGDLDLFPPNQLLLARYKNDEGNYEFVKDIQLGAFGGQLESIMDDNTGLTKMVYRMKLSAHIVDLLNQRFSSPIIEIYPNISTETPNRVVLYGTSGDEKRAKLKIVTTKP